MLDNQSITSLPSDVGPNPLEENGETKTRRCQKLEVHRCPSEPGTEPAYLDFATLQHGKSLSHHGHTAFIEVAEGVGRTLTSDTVVNHLRRVPPLLHCDLCNTWQRL